MRAGVTIHARCVRPGHEVVLSFDYHDEQSPRQLFAAGVPMSIATRFGERTKDGPFEFVALFLNDPTGYWFTESEEGKDAIEILDYVMARHRIDPRRVYLTGVSSGGAGYSSTRSRTWGGGRP